MDSDRSGLWVSTRLLGRGMVAVVCKVAFSSCKAALVAKKEANYC